MKYNATQYNKVQHKTKKGIIGVSCHKYHFCCDKCFGVTNTCLLQQNTSFVTTKVCLSWQTYFCHNKTFVATNIIVMTKLLWWQAYFFHDKHMFVVTKHILCNKKSMLVTTKLLLQETCLSWQIFVAIKVLSQQQYLVVTNIISSQQILSQQAHFCCDNRCV